jgi:rod shape-determining protein MreC
VDYIQNEEKVEKGEWFFTSGDDRVFPKGLPVGQATAVRQGKRTKDVFIAPSGLQGGFEEVLVVLEGVHQPIPEATQTAATLHMLPPPPLDLDSPSVGPNTDLGTDADRLLDRYKRIGEAQGHVFGEGLPGSKPPDFNIDPDKAKRSGPASDDHSRTGTPAASPSAALNPLRRAGPDSLSHYRNTAPAAPQQ